jgi:hypothetical protein
VAKVAVSPELSARNLAESINQAEDRVRACVPAAQMIYIEPEIAGR